MTDIIVAGGGPAGLTAALYAVRASRSVLVLEEAAPGGQINFSPLVENYPGLPASAASSSLRPSPARRRSRGWSWTMPRCWASAREEGGFAVETDGGPLHAAP